ncbi:PLP-dependent aminotransferase family protein [Kineococcus gypseus]|uniref:MocR-like transcription factor YczR n=1 Tax=Kineococcus gypseus TaxID=1637102 RepID=UPI003D7DD729
MVGTGPRSLAPLLDGWRTAGEPAFRSLAARVRLLAVDGRLASGSRLPAERELAAALGVSRTTVSAAYAQLRVSGHLESTRGSGSVVRLPPAPGGRGRAPVVLDLTRAVLPCAPQVHAAAVRAAAELPARAAAGSGYDLVGLPELRELVAARYTARGLPTRADEVLVTPGAQAAIGLLARTLTSPGDRVLVESPTYPHALDALRAVGARPVAVPVRAPGARDAGGWDEEALEGAFARTRPSLAHLMPSFHNPTGAVMPPGQRRAVVELARRYGTRLVVDETTAELAIDGPAPGPFPADAVHVGSVAKTLWGGLRIGWVRADARTVRHLAQHRSPWELGTAVLDQLVVAHALPELDDVLATRREQLRAGRDALLGLLAAHLPGWGLPRVAGGFCAWVELGSESSSALVTAARRRGLHLTAGPRFGLDGAFERFLRVPYGYGTGVLERAVPVLAEAWAEVRTDGADGAGGLDGAGGPGQPGDVV